MKKLFALLIWLVCIFAPFYIGHLLWPDWSGEVTNPVYWWQFPIILCVVLAAIIFACMAFWMWED